MESLRQKYTTTSNWIVSANLRLGLIDDRRQSKGILINNFMISDLILSEYLSPRGAVVFLRGLVHPPLPCLENKGGGTTLANSLIHWQTANVELMGINRSSEHVLPAVWRFNLRINPTFGNPQQLSISPMRVSYDRSCSQLALPNYETESG